LSLLSQSVGMNEDDSSESVKDIDTQVVTTTGTCKAILPDGRLQTVVYTCAPTGYSAVVQFHKAPAAAANHERNQTDANVAVSSPAPIAANVKTMPQPQLHPITEILFRPTVDSSSRRVMTENEKKTTTTESSSSSITTSTADVPAPSAKKMKSESIVPHRFHVVAAEENVRTVSLVQHSLPSSLPLSTVSSSIVSSTSTTPATTTVKGRRRGTTVADVKTSSTTPAAVIRRRKTRLNIPSEGETILQSQPSP
jgi:hypothetical protein